MNKFALSYKAYKISLFASFADNLVDIFNIRFNGCAGLCFEYQMLCRCSFQSCVLAKYGTA